jgi:hypothetical protein
MTGGTPPALGYPIFAAPAAPCPACTVGRLDDLAIALLARIVRGPPACFLSCPSILVVAWRPGGLVRMGRPGVRMYVVECTHDGYTTLMEGVLSEQSCAILGSSGSQHDREYTALAAMTDTSNRTTRYLSRGLRPSHACVYISAVSIQARRTVLPSLSCPCPPYPVRARSVAAVPVDPAVDAEREERLEQHRLVVEPEVQERVQLPDARRAHVRAPVLGQPRAARVEQLRAVRQRG